VIPTVIVFGLVFGRWWRASLLAAAVVWPALLLLDGAAESGWILLAAAGLAVLNAAGGVAVHQFALYVIRSRPR
jgi:hypothetical protein